MKKLYPGRAIDTTDSAVNTWEIMFQDYSKQEVVMALKKLVKKSKYVPSIHEILSAIEEIFTVEKMEFDGVLVLRIKFQDQVIPFKFTDQAAATEVIKYLRQYPSKEDILLLHEKNLRDNNPFVTGLRVDQSDRSAFEERQKSLYYIQRNKRENERYARTNSI